MQLQGGSVYIAKMGPFLIGGGTHRRDHLRKLISDKEIISAIWQGSAARPIQYRGHRKLREIRKQFAEIAGAEDHLPMPDWLKANDAR